VALDPSNPAFLALIAQRLEDLTLAVKEIRDDRQTVVQNSLKITELEKDNSGHHRAIKGLRTFSDKMDGGLKIMFIVVGLAQGIFLLVSGAMFTAYVRGQLTSQSVQQGYNALNQRIDDLRQEIETHKKEIQ